MEVSTTQTPKPNEFVIHQNEAYAGTDIEKWAVVEFLLTKLEPVNIEDLGPDERLCTICHNEFHVSENVKLSHPPIKTVCGHIFGKPCLIKWLDPLCYRGLEEDENGAAITQVGRYGDAKTDCPMCRRVFFPKCRVEPWEYLAQRLDFWDTAYLTAGVARSEKEERSRKLLWEYVEYCHSINDDLLSDDGRLEYDTAQVQFFRFTFNLVHTQQLTPYQEELRMRMAVIGNKDMKVFAHEDGIRYVVEMARVDDALQVTRSRRWIFHPQPM